MPEYTVKQGDCISSIASREGFYWATIWNHDNNSGLKDRRQNPNALQPGDVVFIPDKRIKEVSRPCRRRHVFRLRGIPVRLNLQLLDHDGNPRAGVPYELDVDGSKSQGNIGGDGKISESIPPDAKTAVLTLSPPNESQEKYTLQLGFMNPVDDPGGCQARLKNLGYYRGEITESMDEETVEALMSFQTEHGLPGTGELDEETKQALAARHGG